MRIQFVQNFINLFKRDKHTGKRHILQKFIKLFAKFIVLRSKIFPSHIEIKDNIVLIDSIFPPLYGWRSVESEYFLQNNINVYTMFPMEIGELAYYNYTYGLPYINWLIEKLNRKKTSKENAEIKYLFSDKLYKFKLAYSYFVGETYTLLPFYNKYKIPFVFVLYPGGAFGLTNQSSINMLKEIFKSPYFRKVIATQKVTKDFLIENKLCSENQIEYLYGGYIQFDKEEIPDKKYYYPIDKSTIDICFVAMKYSVKGEDKGYDKFIAAAKILCKKYDYLRFHIVGNWDENEIDVQDIKNKITFYGVRNKKFLKDLYQRMDISISPSTSSKLISGSFDGFPLGVDQMAFGVVNLVTDELNNNKEKIYNDDEIIIIKPDIADIVTKVEKLLNNTNEMYRIGEKGKKKILTVMDTKTRVKHIINILKQESEKIS